MSDPRREAPLYPVDGDVVAQAFWTLSRVPEEATHIVIDPRPWMRLAWAVRDMWRVRAGLQPRQLTDIPQEEQYREYLYANQWIESQVRAALAAPPAPEGEPPVTWEFADLAEETAAGLRRHFAHIGGIPDTLRLTPAHWRLVVLALERAAALPPALTVETLGSAIWDAYMSEPWLADSPSGMSRTDCEVLAARLLARLPVLGRKQ